MRSRCACLLVVSLLLGAIPAWGWEIPLPSLSWLTGDEADRFASLWNEAMGELGDALDRLDQSESLPEERLLGNDRSKNDRKIDAILADVIEILTDSEVGACRQRFAQVRDDLEKRRKKLASLQEKKIGAPEEGGLFQKDRDEIQKRIDEERQAIAQRERELRAIEKELAVQLQKEGVSGTEEQIRGLLSGVTADDVVGMHAVYGNIRLFTDNLTELMEQGGDDLTVARRYYGIYALLLRTCLVMNQRFVEKIDEQYLPNLNSLEMSARSLLEELTVQAQDSTLSERQQQLVQSNRESARLTLDVIGDYRRFLDEQRRQAESDAGRFQRDYSVAYNAYRTMNLARGLLDLVRSNRHDLDAVTRLEIPDIVVFSNERLRHTFQSITDQMRSR